MNNAKFLYIGVGTVVVGALILLKILSPNTSSHQTTASSHQPRNVVTKHATAPIPTVKKTPKLSIAPNFTLDKLEGGKITLAYYRKKNQSS